MRLFKTDWLINCTIFANHNNWHNVFYIEHLTFYGKCSTVFAFDSTTQNTIKLSSIVACLFRSSLIEQYNSLSSFAYHSTLVLYNKNKQRKSIQSNWKHSLAYNSANFVPKLVLVLCYYCYKSMY